MCKSFSELKKTSTTNTLNLIKELEKSTNTYEDEDNKYWKLTIDPKTGNGAALIRFLPAAEGEDVPWVKMYTHSFQNPENGRWYWENCPTTIGRQDCPVCVYNNKLWSTGSDTDKNIARGQKRRLQYISNILVINDPARPENNGKVFLFRYGKTIFDMIESKMVPEQDALGDTVEPVNPFDFWTGCNFKLKANKVDGFIKYLSSEFVSQSQVAATDEEIENIWRQEYKLQPLVAPEQFKTTAELTKKLDYALGKVNKQDNVNTAEVVNTVAAATQKAVDSVVNNVSGVVNDTEADLKYLESLVNSQSLDDDDINF
jgi:hypothetical protein